MRDTAAVLAALVLDAPWGPVEVLVGPEGVVALDTVATGEGLLDDARRRGLPVARPADVRDGDLRALVTRVDAAIRAYLDGRLEALAAVPVAWTPASAFDRAVSDAVRAIPPGSVASYGEVARRAGRPGAARAVGGAVGRNRVGLFIPCHRVIAADGSLGGYGGDPFGGREAALRVKRALLAHEGVVLPATPGLTDANLARPARW
ncbi:MAG TPA: MGMT family protein [Candidatus Limnocylindrales bacterium]|nr:MGMT family protein [Candidatus Limnocylindrales bacterium]